MIRQSHQTRSSRDRRGSVFIVTTIVTIALAATVIGLCRAMSTEAMASANEVAQLQAAAVERGAEQYVLGVLADTSTNPMSLSEDTFTAVQVGNGYFWIVRPDYGDSTLPLYGLVDECAKIDLNYASVNTLYLLPNMPQEVAEAIVDWRDEDENITNNGAESSYYLTLPDPYNAKNGPFETVEELLLVKGVTPQLLYGEALAGPSTTATSSSGSNAGGYTDADLKMGWFDLVTVNGVAPQTVIAGGGGPGGNGGLAVVRGRVNVNDAPRQVLMCIDGLDTTDVDKIIAARPTMNTDTTGDVAWFENAIGSDKMNLVRTQVTGQSYRFSADIVAVSGNGRGFSRVRIVVDTSNTTPRIIQRRDITDRGWPLGEETLKSLRAGKGPGDWSTGMLSSAEVMR